MNFSFILSLIVATTAVVSPADVYPNGMSATSFQKSMAPSPIAGTHDPLEVGDSIVLRQNQSNQQILMSILGLLYIKLLAFTLLLNCIAQTALVVITLHRAQYLRMVSIFPLILILTTLMSKLSASNPSAQNVDTLFNLLIELMDTTNNNTPFLHKQAVEQKHFVLPVSKDIHRQVISQHNIKADTDRTLNPTFMSFPVRTIIPYSKLFQWPVLYPELLHLPPSVFV